MEKYFDPSRRTFAELPRVRESRPFRARMEFGEAQGMKWAMASDSLR
jgi:hypothetical protein